MSKSVKVHGSIKIAGSTGEVENFELETLAVDPVNPSATRMWFNDAVKRIVFAEPGANGSVTKKQVAYTSDVAGIKGVEAIYHGTVPQQQGTTVIAISNNAPLPTEGTLLWSQQITPKKIGNTLLIDFSGIVDIKKMKSSIVLTLWADTTLLAVIPIAGGETVTGGRDFVVKSIIDVSSLNPMTIACRIGAAVSGTTWSIGRPDGNTLGGVNPSYWSIAELAK